MIWRIIATAFILFISGCATGPSPESFDYPFPGKTYVHFLPHNELDAWCGGNAKGCAYSYDRGLPTAVCMMYINSQYRRSAKWLACIKKHENRHCNGYRGEANAC